jgi:ATP-dependent DNA helicase RecQ
MSHRGPAGPAVHNRCMSLSPAPAADPQQVLHDVFGYDEFRGAQRPIIEHVTGGGDALVLMPTGGGKSLCYQIPALVRPGTGVVVSPLIALMHDQVAALQLLGVQAAYLNSSLDPAAAADVQRRLADGDLDLLYVAPERLVAPAFLASLDRLHRSHGIGLFAIDEAHCVSQWGHDFRPEYLDLAILAERFGDVPRIALTATADALTREEIRQRLVLTAAEEFVASFDRPNIRYTVVPKDDARRQLLGFLTEFTGDSGIVYCGSRRKVEQTADWLRGEGYRALAYHAGMDAAARREAQDRFQRDDGLIVVATIAFGMGIDKPDVRFVAHLDLPKSLEAYYQETGRAGRDGEPAQAWLTYGLADVITQRSWIESSQAPPDVRRVEAAKLDALLGYCETASCRRVVLLDYFGEQAQPCGNCDTCLSPPTLWDATIPAQKFLSAVVRTGQRFGAGHVIDVLLGRRTDRMAALGHDQVPTFGVGGDLDERSWRSVARQLVALGYLTADPHGGLRTTAAADDVLRGRITLELRPLPPRAAGRPKSVSRGAAAPIALQDADAALFERLRAARKTIAEEQGVPAYVVLHDATLREIATSRPMSIPDLLALPGIGAAKADRYGEHILSVVAQQ